jgi:DNA ligase-1
MNLATLVAASQQAAATRSRLGKRDALAACLREAAPDEIETVVACLSGETRQNKLGVGYATLSALRGEAAAAQATLTIADVSVTLARIAAAAGKGSANERALQLRALLGRATHAEQDFLVRLMIGELRQGALEGVMIDAVAAAAAIPVAAIRRAAMFAGDLAVVARIALTEGAPGLDRFSIELNRPVQPMLAQPAVDVADALEQLGTASFEWKIDGARVQVHKQDEQVRVFTRSLNEVTAAVPEIVEAVRSLSTRVLILDGEAIAIGNGGAPQPFQVTMRRFGRKLDVDRLRAELPLAGYFFDCLRLDDVALVDRPAQERFAVLGTALPESMRVPRIVTSDATEAQAFYADALARGHEGLMAKALDAPYEAGSRGASWLKIKRAHTLDLVVLAAEWGSGRRRGWLSNLHLGARDPTGGGFVMLGKTFKGLTDQLLEWQTRELLARETARDDYTVHVRPELVVEIAFNDLQASPRYPGGLALRFARVKGYRIDKRVDETDTVETVRKIFDEQMARTSE